MAKTPVAIVGPTGYTGLFLIDWLLRHPSVDITYLASRRDPPPDIAEIFPRLLGRLSEKRSICRPIDPDAIAREAEVVFLCLPHKAAMAQAPALIDAGLRVIDLSADYRIRSAEQYETIYDTPHVDTTNLAQAVYGLPELFREDLAGAMLIANPGCYPTAAALAVAPLLHRDLVKPDHILVNAASGVTGAGKSPKEMLHFPEQNESYMAYGAIGGHRHQPEIEQTLEAVAEQEVGVLFVPHLLPLDQGILETIYLDPVSESITEEDLFDAYEEAYAEEPFVRVRNELPNVKHVRNTNFCDVTVRCVQVGGRSQIVAFSAIDNMVKGASGQAVQNLNAMLEIDETTGLL